MRQSDAGPGKLLRSGQLITGWINRIGEYLAQLEPVSRERLVERILVKRAVHRLAGQLDFRRQRRSEPFSALRLHNRLRQPHHVGVVRPLRGARGGSLWQETKRNQKAIQSGGITTPMCQLLVQHL
ncbi:hypothetical protein D3C84_1044530 [compost metagenome]